MGINTMNGFLKDMEYPYEIISKQVNTKNFRGTVWIANKKCKKCSKIKG